MGTLPRTSSTSWRSLLGMLILPVVQEHALTGERWHSARDGKGGKGSSDARDGLARGLLPWPRHAIGMRQAFDAQGHSVRGPREGAVLWGPARRPADRGAW